MSTFTNLQEQFIHILKEKLPPHVSLADEVAELLNISNDSAYRRIRGNTLFTLDEILLLSAQYNISLDGLSGKAGDFVTFKHIPIDNENFSIKNLFDVILRDFEEAEKIGNEELFYLARDLPIFYLQQFSEICAFKIFFWQKFHEDPNSLLKFNPDKIDPGLIQLGRKIWNEYVKVPSTEIWGVPTYEALVEEIGFMWESSQIESKEIALTLCEKTAELILHVKKQAELGYKFSQGQTPVERKDNFKLYFTEIQLTHNKVLVNGDIKRAYIPTSLDTLVTTDEYYFKRNFSLFQSAIKRSTLISVTGEKVRNTFVGKCLQKIDHLKARIKGSEE